MKLGLKAILIKDLNGHFAGSRTKISMRGESSYQNVGLSAGRSQHRNHVVHKQWQPCRNMVNFKWFIGQTELISAKSYFLPDACAPLKLNVVMFGPGVRGRHCYKKIKNPKLNIHGLTEKENKLNIHGLPSLRGGPNWADRTAQHPSRLTPSRRKM